MKQELLEKSERDGKAHFAFGGCYSEEAPDIRKAMQIADARMYESKADYYARHPERVWHGKPT